MTEKKIFKLDLSEIDDGQIELTHSYDIDSETKFFQHFQVNEETDKLFINLQTYKGEKSSINVTESEIYELDLQTLLFEKKIGQKYKYGSNFFVSEKYRKVLGKKFRSWETGVYSLSRNF